jgi:hypothetical protein
MKSGQPSQSPVGPCLIPEPQNVLVGVIPWHHLPSPMPKGRRHPPQRGHLTRIFSMPQHWSGMPCIVTMKKERMSIEVA